MLRGNLASRPFYNERLVNILLLIAGIAAVALTLFNTTRIIQLSTERTRRTEVQRAAEAETVVLRGAADKERRSVDRNTLGFLGLETFEANALIEKRLFSWTIFFGLIEKTLPLDVRVVVVAPRVERGELLIEMSINAKRRDDIAVFLDALQDTGSFYDMNAGLMEQLEDGSYNATLTGGYLAPVIRSAKTTPAAGGAQRP
jgi:uncharacterized membrane protein